MRRLLLIAPLVLVCGCHSLTWESPTGEKFKRLTFGNKTTIGDLVLERPDGTKVTIKGYSNDQVEFAERVTRAAVEAAVKSAAP